MDLHLEHLLLLIDVAVQVRVRVERALPPEVVVLHVLQQILLVLHLLNSNGLEFNWTGKRFFLPQLNSNGLVNGFSGPLKSNELVNGFSGPNQI